MSKRQGRNDEKTYENIKLRGEKPTLSRAEKWSQTLARESGH